MLQGCWDGAGKSFAASGSSAGAGRGVERAELTDDYWLELWAFGTSRDGLGLLAEKLWALSPREYCALRRVYVEARRGGAKVELPNKQSVEEKKAVAGSIFAAAAKRFREQKARQEAGAHARP